MMHFDLQDEIRALRRDWLLIKAAIAELEYKALRYKASGDDSEPWNGDDDGDFDEDDIKTGDVLPGKEVPGPDGKVPNVANIFIGGADDLEGMFGNHPVLRSSSLSKEVYGKNYYATYDKKDEINKQISQIPPGTKINLIGHSYGGDTAARVALDNPGRISTLVTVDPVTTFNSLPNFDLLNQSVGRWIDINATGNPSTNLIVGFGQGNLAAGFGAWNNSPATHAAVYSEAPYNHADFSQMMRHPVTGSNNTTQLLNP